MLVVMKAQATPGAKSRRSATTLKQLGFRAHPTARSPTNGDRHYRQQRRSRNAANLEELSGVAEVIRVTKAYKLASRDIKEDDNRRALPWKPMRPSGAGTWPSSRGPCFH